MSTRRVVPWLLALGFAAVALAADTGAIGPGVAAKPLPKGLKVSAQMDRDTIVMGEGPMIHLAVKNEGTEPFTITTGWDYRGSPRPLRFRVRAQGEDGKFVEDPYPDPMNMGGMGGDSVVKPGETLYFSTELMRHCRFTKPGTYTISIGHDLGFVTGAEFREKKVDLPETLTATLKVKIVEPDEAAAKKVLQQLEKLPKEPSWSAGEKKPECADYEVLRHPIYLPLLVARLDEGKRNIVDGIHSIETPEATLELIKLLSSRNHEQADCAGRWLWFRIPLENSKWAWQDKDLPKRTWDPKLNAPAHDAALVLLKELREPLAYTAGLLLQATATKDDLPAILACIDTVLAGNNRDRVADYSYIDPPCRTSEIIEAAVRLVQKGAAIDDPPKSAAQTLVYLSRLKAEPDFRPKSWQQVCEKALDDKHPYVRQLALYATPSPMPEACRKRLPQLLKQEDAGVLMVACQCAGEEKDASCGPAILEVLKNCQTSFPLNNAANAAEPVGVYVEALEIMADRIGDHESGFRAFQFLTTVVKNSSTSGGYDSNPPNDFKTIGERWKKFIKEHREELKRGEKFPVGEGGITEDFVPRGASFTVNGKSWPTRK